MRYTNPPIWRVKPPPGTPLVGGLFAPDVLCLPFNELNSSGYRNYALRGRVLKQSAGSTVTNMAVPTAGTVALVQGPNGPMTSLTTTSTKISCGFEEYSTDNSGASSGTQTTILCGIRKQDATQRDAAWFGLSTGNNAERYDVQTTPAGVIQWDFGGQDATHRLATSAITFVAGVTEVWGFTAGPRGQEIWRNGSLIASNASTAISRTINTTETYEFSLGPGGGNSATDLIDYDFFYIWSTQLPQNVIQATSTLPYSVFTPIRPRKLGFATAVTVNESYSANAAGSASFALSSANTSYAANASGAAAFTGTVSVFNDSFASAAAGAAAFSATLPTNFANSASAEAAFSVAVALSITLAAAGTCEFTQGLRVLLEAAGEAAFTPVGTAVDHWTASASGSAFFTHQISVESTPSIVVVVTDGGSGYVTPPTVTITGDGTGATAVAVLGTGELAGTVVAVVVTNSGEDYADPLTVSFDDSGTGGSGAAADAATTNITSQQEAKAIPFAVVRDGYAQLTIETNFSTPAGPGGNDFSLLPPPLNQPVLGTAALIPDAQTPDPLKLVHERAWNTWFQQLYNQLKTSAGSIAPGITTLELVCPSVDDTDSEWYAISPGSDEVTDPLTIEVELVGESRFGMQFVVQAGGMDYASAPTVTITGTGGSGFGATAEATVEAGAVVSVRALTSGYGYKSPISVSLTGGGGTGALVVGTPGRQWAEGDYILWNDPAFNDTNLRSYEIDLIKVLTPMDSTHMSIQLERKPASSPAGFAQYNSLMRPHDAGIQIYRLINKSFIVMPSTAGPQIQALLWASMTVCAVTGKVPGFAAATFNLAPEVEDQDPDTPVDRLLPPSPGLRTLTGAAYTNLGVSGTLAVGQTAVARVSVQAWESIRCVYGKVKIEPEGPVEFEGNEDACVVIYVCYISPPDENGDQFVGLIDTIVIDDGMPYTYPDDNAPDGRTMPYHAFWPLGMEQKQDWPPTRLPLCVDALDPNGDLLLPITIDPTESVLFHPDGEIDFIISQVGSVTEGADLIVTVQT